MLRRSWRTDNNRTIHLGGGKWRDQMKIIVGLGNPGAKYAGTRHNVGFAVLDELAERHNIRIDTAKHKALIGKGIIDGEKVILAMPQTFMNLSGESVRAIMDFYKCTVEDLIVVYDDIDLDVGKLRIRQKGSAGGHNGLKNIIAHCGTQDFLRIRIGVGKLEPGGDMVAHVLGRMPQEDRKLAEASFDRAISAILLILDGQVEKAESL